MRWFLIRELAAFIQFSDLSTSVYILRFGFWITAMIDYTTGGRDILDCLLLSVLVYFAYKTSQKTRPPRFCAGLNQCWADNLHTVVCYCLQIA